VTDQNERISDLGDRFEQQIVGASGELAAKLDALSERADGIEKALGARLEQIEGEVQALRG